MAIEVYLWFIKSSFYISFFFFPAEQDRINREIKVKFMYIWIYVSQIYSLSLNSKRAIQTKIHQSLSIQSNFFLRDVWEAVTSCHYQETQEKYRFSNSDRRLPTVFCSIFRYNSCYQQLLAIYSPGIYLVSALKVSLAETLKQ